ncbi:unnamed protein product, partial [Rotaria magnacalcarata]
EFIRFTPVLKPMLFIHDENSIENRLKDVEVVFKKVQYDIVEPVGNLSESADGLNQANTTEIV